MPISAIASSGRPPISPHTRTGTSAAAAASSDAPQEAQDRRAQPVVALGQPRIGAVGGEQELGQIVGADRQEIDLAAAGCRASRPGSALRASRHIRSAWGPCARSLGPCDLLLEQRAWPPRYSHGSLTIGNITRRTLPADASISARACAFISVERSRRGAARASPSPDSPPRRGRRRDRAAPCRRRYRPCGRRPACSPAASSTFV